MDTSHFDAIERLERMEEGRKEFLGKQDLIELGMHNGALAVVANTIHLNSLLPYVREAIAERENELLARALDLEAEAFERVKEDARHAAKAIFLAYGKNTGNCVTLEDGTEVDAGPEYRNPEEK